MHFSSSKLEVHSVNQQFETQVRRSPQAIAVEFAEQQLTYQALDERANQLAHYLQSSGITTDSLVGICFDRSIEMIVAILGILKAGGAYVPLDPAYPTDRLSYMLETARVSVLLTQSHLIDRFSGQETTIVCLDTNEATLAKHHAAQPSHCITPDHLAYVIYTSGSTGKPKGVAMPHRPLLNLIDWQVEHSVVTTGKTLQFSPISFDVSFQEIFSTLAVGGTLVLTTEETRKDPLKLLRFLDQAGIERLFLPFVALQHLAEVAEGIGIVLSSLREVITAGEQLRITPAIAHWFEQLPNCTLHNHYGPSESHVVTAYQMTGAVSEWMLLPPIGKPIANTQIHLLDAQLQPVPCGSVGEIYISGVCLAQGYLHRPDLTADRFITLPGFSRAERLYKTGDLARFLPNGNLEYLGRADEQVKIRGYRIEPGEIESLLEQHAAVRAAVVIVREDIPQDRRLVGYIVPVPPTLDASQLKSDLSKELRQFLATQLPEYMLPSAIVCLDAFPLTPSGKIDRRHLPAPVMPRLGSMTIPETATQFVLAEIWATVLGLDQVGIHDHFLELGGHSLLAIQVVSRIRDRFHVELSLRCLLESPTIAQLAEQVAAAQQTEGAIAAIQPITRGDHLPLSFMQESLWFLDQLMPNHPFYNVPEAFCLQGSLNVAALEQSFQVIINRHESVRTRFTSVVGKPVQVIQPPPAFRLPVVDLALLSGSSSGSSSGSNANLEVEAFLLKEARLPFNLAEDLLLRATLFKLSETEHILLVTMHHIVTDGWSIAVLLEELTALYKEFTSGQRFALPELKIQYADFAIWQQQWLHGDVRSKQLDYWQQQLSDLPLLQLPTDRARPSSPTYQGARQFLTLSPSLTQKLQELSRQEGVTLFVTLLSAFQTLLFRYTGQTDLPIGSLVANRSRSELEPLIGFFVNTLVLRTNLSGSPSFRQLMHRVRSITLDAYAHQDLPFEKLVQALHPDRDLNQNPLVQVLFNLQNTPTAIWDVPGLSLTHLPIDNQTAKFDLFLELTETPTGLMGFFEYSTDLFETATIARMLEHFQTLLEDIVANPDQPLAEITLMNAAEQQQIQVWNETFMDFPAVCLHHLIEAQVDRTPDAIAVEFSDQQLTYRQLNQRANQLAHHLQALGVQPNVLVGVFVERSLDLIVGLLGILKAGGAYVPIDPAYPQERIGFMLEDAQVQVLVTQQPLLEKLPAHSAATVCLDRDWETIATASPENLNSAVQPSDLAYILYTSGSTGKPKGVQIEQRSIVNLLTFMQQEPGLHAQDVLLAVTTISFDIAAVEMYLPLTVGARTVMVSRCVAADAARLVKTLEKSEATFMQATPATWRLLLAAGWQGNPNLRIVCCGEALSRELANHLLKRCHTLWNMYGPTETTIYSTIHQVQPEGNLVPIGRPVANTQILLLTETEGHLHPVPIGVPGELYIGGIGLAQAYLNRPELTAERFIQYSADCQNIRLYKTGDLAQYQPDGTIEYLGRIDHQVKIRGFRIELGEIETVLSQHPNVRESIVIAREELSEGALGHQRLIAYVVSRHLKGTTHLVSELRAFLRRKLPEFMVPAAFVMVDSLPITPNGKVDRRALPDPNPNRPDLESEFVAPRTATEQQLAQIWTQALGINRVGIHDNFFDLGGHSLLAAQILFQIQTVFGIELALRNIFLAPTIAEFSQLITEQQIGNSNPSIASTLDLKAESALDSTIDGTGLPIASLLSPQNVLLTGVTGFLGAFLLHEILEQTQANVYCLLRASDEKDAIQKLQRSLEFYSLWHPSQGSRIIPVTGDLSSPKFGLSSQQFDSLAATIDVIYHNASWVNFVYPYSVLKTTNVQGTQEILRLASHTKVKAVHFLSSLGVYAPSAYSDGVIQEHDLPDRTAGLYGYTQTKWVAENLIRTAQMRGIPTAIYRPAWIEGHSQTGVCNHSDFLRSMIKGCIQLGMAPDWNMPVDIVPVDFVSRSIVHLSQQDTSFGKTFNLSNPSTLSWHQFLNWLGDFGYSLNLLDYQEWKSKAVDRIRTTPDNALYPYLAFLTEHSEAQMTVPEIYYRTNQLQFDCQNVMNGLEHSEITYPTIDNQLLLNYFSHFINSGFLTPPC